jgi:hypothetical protein
MGWMNDSFESMTYRNEKTSHCRILLNSHSIITGIKTFSGGSAKKMQISQVQT